LFTVTVAVMLPSASRLFVALFGNWVSTTESASILVSVAVSIASRMSDFRVLFSSSDRSVNINPGRMIAIVVVVVTLGVVVDLLAVVKGMVMVMVVLVVAVEDVSAVVVVVVAAVTLVIVAVVVVSLVVVVVSVLKVVVVLVVLVVVHPNKTRPPNPTLVSAE